jgi:hypothetical protein
MHYNFFFKNVSIKIQFNYEFKYNAQTIYNKHFYLCKQKVRSENDDPQQSNIVI